MKKNKSLYLNIEKGTMNSEPKPIQLGLCCLNITMKSEGIYPSRKIIQRIIKRDGIIELKRRVTENLQDLVKMIEWNEEHGIRVFRLSSELFPHYTNPKVENYTMKFAYNLLKQVGDTAKKYGHRLTFHPGQYNVVGTPHEEMFLKTVLELKYHAQIMNRMGIGLEGVMVVHGGGIYGDKEATKKRWIENYKKLPSEITDRLVLENCERAFSIKDCLEVSEGCGVPVVFDTHHFECYKLLHPGEEFKPGEYYMPLILNTWKRKNVKPKFHVSEQGSGRCGHHSDYIEKIPNYLMEIPKKYGVDIDIMIEAKKKELAIFKLYEKYPELNCLKKGIRKKKKNKPYKIKIVTF